MFTLNLDMTVLFRHVTFCKKSLKYQAVIRSRKSKKDIQYNDQKKRSKGQKDNNDPQYTTQKTKV